MAKRGKRRHIKGLNAPRYFAIHRKERVYVTKPNPGRHTLENSLPLQLLVEKLDLAKKSAESRKIIKGGNILVNNKTIREPKYPVGLNDTIEVAHEKMHYKLGINRLGQVLITKIEKAELDSRVFKVIGKYKARENRIMLRLHDGSTIKGSNEIKVNDSLLLDSESKVTKVLKLQVGSDCAVIDGVHVGVSGKIKELIKGTMQKSESAIIEQSEGSTFETLVKNIMVTG